MPKPPKQLLRNRLSRTRKLKKLNQRPLLNKKDCKKRLPTLQLMSKKWLKRLLFSPNLKLKLMLPKLDKLLLQRLLPRLKLRDKKLRTRKLLLRHKELLMSKELHRPSKLLLRPPTPRLPPPIRLRISRLKLLLLKQDPRLTLRLPRRLSRPIRKRWKGKELPMRLDSRSWLTNKLLKSRLLKKLLKRLTIWLSPPDKLKRRDKLPTTLKRWPLENLNSVINSSTFGSLDQLASPRSPSPFQTLTPLRT
jgi:hypothetical protein